MQRTEKDFWIEMAVREISTQCKFSIQAYDRLMQLTDTDTVFSSAHSFLSHAAMVSKLLKSKEGPRDTSPWKIRTRINNILGRKRVVIEKILGIRKGSVIHKRTLRNSLEHYDEELKDWIRNQGVNNNLVFYSIGPKNAIVGNIVFISYFDPQKRIFTFVNKDFNLEPLLNELVSIKKTADDWLLKNIE